MGLIHANDLQWQALALKHGFALLGTKLPTDYETKNRYPDDPCNSWALIDRGSEKALLSALHKFGVMSQHPELAQIPWAIWGHSGGADWAIQMAQKYPKRTLAVVAVRGGGVQVGGPGSSLILTSKIGRFLLEVPVLFALGEKESHAQEALELPREIFKRYRKAGAPWAIAIEADAGHETADTRLLAIPYLDTILTARFKSDETKIRQIDAAQGWLGNLITHTIAPVNQYKDNHLDAAWLPNEETARKWKAYITKPGTWNQIRFKFCSRKELVTLIRASHLFESCYPDKIAPSQKPAAPINVQAIYIEEKEAVISWDYLPDLENGLPTFRIYRNNSLIATLQGQGYDGGDRPKQPKAILEFRDIKATTNALYIVSASNSVGESISEAIQSIEFKKMK
jgi:hypothetical protein